MTKAIIFDLWGTIVENGVYPSPAKQVKYFLRTQIPFSEFITTFEYTFMTQEHESLKAAFEKVVSDFNLRIPEFVYEKLVGTWNKNVILSKMYEETQETLNELKDKGYKIFLLANIDKFSFEQMKEKFKLDELFDGIYPSYETGLLKMNPESYKKILTDNNLKEEEVLMVGDCLLSDMESAKNAGIKGLLIDRRNKREYENKIETLKDIFTKLEETN
ncbi:HAD family hydrolase [Candidatus Woesearchaeota archaeon]|nr:HAD family hydrolase [Candidatus Woesearchaeota archaeon]MCF7901135.1 HAD family hydrolase [Candidatus Woesearchaeota archaeon]MCF8013688.1 HAD family hydrolase [Candidatus Woesearchaeota archaeon]